MDSRRGRRPAARVGTLVAGVLVTLAVVSGCTGGGGTGASSGASSGASGGASHGARVQPAAPDVGDASRLSAKQQGGAVKQQGAEVKQGGAAAAPGQAGGTADLTAAVEQRREVTTAELTVRTGDVRAAAARVSRAAAAAKGFVSDERTSSEGGRTESLLTVRVPAAALDRVMDEAAATGTALERTRTSEDVSGTYVDAASRVRSQTASVERVRALLARATTIGQVVQVESELARREADLDALKAQLQRLDEQTTLATLAVSLVPPPASAPSTQAGFGGGLRAGWHALAVSAAIALAVLGAVLPFAVLLALVAGPAVVLLRRRRRPAPAPGPAASTP